MKTYQVMNFITRCYWTMSILDSHPHNQWHTISNRIISKKVQIRKKFQISEKFQKVSNSLLLIYSLKPIYQLIVLLQLNNKWFMTALV